MRLWFKKIKEVSNETHRYSGSLKYLAHAYLDPGWAAKDKITELRTDYSMQGPLCFGEVWMFEYTGGFGQWIRRYYRFSHSDPQLVVNTCEKVLQELNDKEFHNISIIVESGKERFLKILENPWYYEMELVRKLARK